MSDGTSSHCIDLIYIIYISGFVQCLEEAFYLYEKGVGEEVRHSYLQLAQNLEEFVGKMFNDWTHSVEKELERLLQQPLMLKKMQKLGKTCPY